ncbi:hypothetical protein TSUD_89290 [Trifolium subterraneum]|uniref:Pentacotripeptide-repeat region of PRORP domain-containing protein n=1 Tax=Trifolium subterraneum TaxID=3900 RepID=A0A2Z6LN03_TRISU|nr:hypothetical protein TSUD_89290 [Trifolium subterraneum]
MKSLKTLKSKSKSIYRQPKTLSTTSPLPPPITETTLVNSIKSSQWHFIKHVVPQLTPSLISSTLTNLHQNPSLVQTLLSHLHNHPHCLDLNARCIALCILYRLPSPQPSFHILHPIIDTTTPAIIFNQLSLVHSRLNTKTTIVYDILLTAYCQLKKPNQALECFNLMKENGILPAIDTCNRVLSMGRISEADEMFKKSKKEGLVPDIIMFNALIDGHCANGNIDRAFQLLNEMDNAKILPDEITYNTLMQGYCREGKVEEAQTLLDEMKRRGIKPDHISYNTLISGYSKRGDIKDALKVYDEMLSIGFDPTILTYNALIQGHCKIGEVERAEELFFEMKSKGITPDDNTYLYIIEARKTDDDDLVGNDDK